MKFLSKKEMSAMAADEFEKVMDAKLENSLHYIDLALRADDKITNEEGDEEALNGCYRHYLANAAASVIEYSRMARYLAKINKSKA